MTRFPRVPESERGKITNRLDDLDDLMRRARAVLKDREVGLFTWWESLDSLMDQIWKKWHDANE